jgi:hypothetical protein
VGLADAECLSLWETLSCGYTETQGFPLLRGECAKLINDEMRSPPDHPIAADDILMFAGGEEGIFTMIKSLLCENDHAIIVAPCYQSVKSIAETTCKVTLFDLNPQQNWNLDISKLETIIEPSKTKMILINFPNNPTGATISRSQQLELVNLAQKYGLWIFSDEIYYGIHRSEESPLCMATLYDRAISLGGVSKSFGLAGLRIGWLCTRNRGALNQLAGNKHYLSICNSAPSEILSLIALRGRKAILKRQSNIIAENLICLREFIARHSDLFEWVEPSGGCCGFMKILNRSMDLDVVAEHLANETGILILPGSNFPCSAENRVEMNFYMRIGFGRKTFRDSLRLFEEVIPLYFRERK